jgi:hypothetical protein
VFAVVIFLLMQSKLRQRAGIKDDSEAEPLLKPSTSSGSQKDSQGPSTSGAYGAAGESQA